MRNAVREYNRLLNDYYDAEVRECNMQLAALKSQNNNSAGVEPSGPTSLSKLVPTRTREGAPPGGPRAVDPIKVEAGD